MQTKNKSLILYLTKTKLKSVNVVLGDKPKVVDVKEVSWTAEDLPKALEKIKKQYKTSSARVVFGDLISYVVELSVPKDVENKKAFIGIKVAETIPEILENSDWDFIEIGEEKNSRKVKVFAPHKDFLTSLTLAANKSGFEIEAIEPESLAALRDKDPMIGLALKKDIKGKDEEVLNMVPAKPVTEELTSTPEKDASEVKTEPVEIKEIIKLPGATSEGKKFNFKVFLLIFLGLILVGGLTFGGIMVARDSLKQSPFSTASPTPTSIPAPLPTAVPETPTKEELKIDILNGSGKVGLAGTAKSYLEGLGYKNIETGNAESYSYPKTTVSMKEDVLGLQEQLIKDLSVKFSVASPAATLEQDNLFDVVIILGKK